MDGHLVHDFDVPSLRESEVDFRFNDLGMAAVVFGLRDFRAWSFVPVKFCFGWAPIHLFLTCLCTVSISFSNVLLLCWPYFVLKSHRDEAFVADGRPMQTSVRVP